MTCSPPATRPSAGRATTTTRVAGRTRVLGGVVGLVAGIALAACGSSAPTGPIATSSPPSAPAAPAAGVPALTGTPTDLTAATQAQAGVGQPPTTLVTQDVVTGSGPAATPTDTVDVQYTGTLYSDGTLFDSSWSRGQPATFPLNQVVEGFTQGITGMQPGGRRVLVIPPALGYGDATRGPIPGGSTLVFVVDLVKIA